MRSTLPCVTSPSKSIPSTSNGTARICLLMRSLLFYCRNCVSHSISVLCKSRDAKGILWIRARRDAERSAEPAAVQRPDPKYPARPGEPGRARLVWQISGIRRDAGLLSPPSAKRNAGPGIRRNPREWTPARALQHSSSAGYRTPRKITKHIVARDRSRRAALLKLPAFTGLAIPTQGKQKIMARLSNCL